MAGLTEAAALQIAMSRICLAKTDHPYGCESIGEFTPKWVDSPVSEWKHGNANLQSISWRLNLDPYPYCGWRKSVRTTQENLVSDDSPVHTNQRSGFNHGFQVVRFLADFRNPPQYHPQRNRPNQLPPERPRSYSIESADRRPGFSDLSGMARWPGVQNWAAGHGICRHLPSTAQNTASQGRARCWS